MECHYCGDMSLSSLRSRLAFFSESSSAPRALPLFSSQGSVRKKQRGRGSHRSEMSKLTPTDLFKKKKKNFLCHIHNYTEYNQKWNLCSAFNPSKCTHTWSSGQPTLWRPGSSWGFGTLLKGLTSDMDNSCWIRDSNPQPQVTSPTLYPLGHDLFGTITQGRVDHYEFDPITFCGASLYNTWSLWAPLGA